MADINLTALGASHTFADGSVFYQAVPDGSGTGNYDPFLTVGASPTESGFNTNQNGNLNNVMGGDRTVPLLLSDVPIKTIGGVQYYQLSLDLNESGNDPIVSIERLQLYTSATIATSATYNASGDAFRAVDGFAKVFDLDAGADNRVIMDYSHSSGSGTDDYVFLIPVANFGAVNPATTYLTMYTLFGETSTANDSEAGFEEWRTQKSAVINGVKFLDTDGDGVKDAGENGLGGVTVFIDTNRNGKLDAGERSTVTAADGSFHFYGVTPDSDGAVWIDEVVPVGYHATTGNEEIAVLVSGKNFVESVSVEIGNQPDVGTISGTKTEDTNNDNTGDKAVAGWGVSLYSDVDGDGKLNLAVDKLVASTTTGADGKYSFAGVMVGKYLVVEETKAGWQSVTGVTDQAEELTPGETATHDFVNEQLGSISGTKTEDTDNNDSGDKAVSGWSISLYKDNGDGKFDAATDKLVNSTKTDVDGKYSFTGLETGNYFVVEETKAGWKTVAVGTATQAEALTPGENATHNFVNEQLGSITGFKFGDVNGDGVWGGTEVGLTGWTIKLYNDVNGDGNLDAVDTLAATTVTGKGGAYSFANLETGKYIVVEEARNGWMQTAPNSVDLDIQSGDVDGFVKGMAEYGYAINLTPGLNDGDNNFGNFLVPGPGVRTPGFWASKNGLTFWDTSFGTAKSGANFADHDLLDYNGSGTLTPEEKYLYLGDWDQSTTFTGENGLRVDISVAVALINASDKDQQDGRWKLGRDVIATWLNYLAENSVSDGDPSTVDPKEILQDAIDWLKLTVDGNGNGILELAEIQKAGNSPLYQPAIANSSALWTAPTAGNVISAADMHNALDEYNNFGTMSLTMLGQGTIQYAFDAD